MTERNGFPIDQVVHAVFYGAKDGFCLYNSTEEDVFVNRAFCQLLGYGCELDEQQHRVTVLPEHLKQQILVQYPMIFGQADPAITYFEKEIRTEEGESVQLGISRNALLFEGEEIQISVIRNMTHLRKTERQKEEAERIIHHDLRNYLSAPLGLLEMLSHRLAAEQEQRQLVGYLDMIRDSLNAALDITDSHTKMMQIEDRTYVPTTAPFDLVAMLRAMEHRHQSGTAPKGVRLVFTVDGMELATATPITIMSDRILLERSLRNFLRNAIEASAKGDAVTVTTARRDGSVLIDIHNHAAIPEHIRSGFLRTKYQTTKNDGTGLGAYYSGQFIKTIGGEVSFTSTESEGTHLLIKVPVGWAGSESR